MAFRMAINATPTSANTASHMVATPKAPSSSTAPLTPRANQMFCLTMRRVFRAVSYTHLTLPTICSV